MIQSQSHDTATLTLSPVISVIHSLVKCVQTSTVLWIKIQISWKLNSN